MKKRDHIVFFSQTGTEILKLAETVGEPSLIVTNIRPYNKRLINPELLNKYKVVYLPNKPEVKDYLSILQWFDNPLVTLHGWLRIIPPKIAEIYEIYNLHPGDLVNCVDSEGKRLLAGKDPQIRAYDLKLSRTGNTIHRVTAGVDEGPIILFESIDIKGLKVQEIFTRLHESAISLWKYFLIGKL